MRPTLPAFLNAARSLVFATAEARDAGRHPTGRVITCTPCGSAFGRGMAFQVRVLLPDGSLWSGRSSSGGSYATLFPMSEHGHTAQTIRKTLRLYRGKPNARP